MTTQKKPSSRKQANKNSRKRQHDIATVLSSWGIDPKHPLADVLKYISETSIHKEELKDSENAYSVLSSHIVKCEYWENKTRHYGYPGAGILNVPVDPKISPLDLIQDWDLPYHQGRAIDHIYDALFGRLYRVGEGETYLDHLRKANRMLRYRRNFLIHGY